MVVMWMVQASAEDVHGSLPSAASPSVWLEVEPDCPWGRRWLEVMLRAPGREVPVVAVSEASLEAWSEFLASVGDAEGLAVISDPSRSTHDRRFPPDHSLGTTSLFDGERLLRSYLPVRADDLGATRTLAWLADPSSKPKKVKGHSTVLYSVYSLSANDPRFTRRVARYVNRPDDEPTAWLAVDLARQVLDLPDPTPDDGALAQLLLERAGALLPADPALSALADRARRLTRGLPEPEPVAPPAELSGEQLATDLLVLSTWLERWYSGYDDLDAHTGGFAAHVEAHAAEARARASWTVEEAFAWLVDDVLQPLDDPHVNLWFGADRSRGDRWLGKDVDVVYTDLRLDAHGVVVQGPDAWSGRSLVLPDVPVFPDDVALDTVYRFPSVAADGTPLFLVGALVVGGLDTLDVDGTPLPTHPPGGRVAPDAGPAWSREGHHLAVRTMDPDAVADMPATAADLRALPRVLLDLRGNEGGSDDPASSWTHAFSGGRYTTQRASIKLAHGWFSGAPHTEIIEQIPAYRGQLDVLIDASTCSSGESMTFLASQVPGARLFGENTAGCLGNGNVTWIGTLPALRVDVAFGTIAHGPGPRPSRESWGIFPDLWLDEQDPVSFIDRLPGGSASGTPTPDR